MFKTGKKTQQKAAPRRAMVMLNLWLTYSLWILSAPPLCFVSLRRIAMVAPINPPNSKMVILPPILTEKRVRICRLSSYVMVPKIEMNKASSGPALPPIAAKAIHIERAHLKAPTAVFPYVSAVFSSERYVLIYKLSLNALSEF